MRARVTGILASAISAVGMATLVVAVPAASPAAAATTYGGYLFAYFAGEGTADGEQIRFAVSRGNDPLRYDVINQGKPVLVSTVGTRGVRDPFIMRKQDGTFILIATDLRIYQGAGWDASQRTGSRSVVVWTSSNLINWSAPRLTTVMNSTAGNVWAPEAYWDSSLGKYVMFWASKLYSTSDPNHTANTYNKMLYSTTTDFVSFSTPQVWNDPGYSVIDSTVTANNGNYYRFTKDERTNTNGARCGKFITEEKATSLTSRSYTFVKDCIGSGSVNAGEGPTIFKSNTEGRWYLFVDEFGGRGYIPFTTTNLDGGTWTEAQGVDLPANPRHGTVMPITTAELHRVAGATSQISTTTGRRSMQAVTAGTTNRYWAHYAFTGVTSVVTGSTSTLLKQDATWTVKPGLADSSCYSFASANHPDRYLRHYAFVLKADVFEDNPGFRADATFCATSGKSGQGVSWRSYNIPTRFIRQYANNLYLGANGGPNTFDSTGNYNADVTWLNQAPWAP
jgi:hypothetical protein